MASDARELAQRVEELEAQLAQLVLVASGERALRERRGAARVAWRGDRLTR
jgi:hypothetical protein